MNEQLKQAIEENFMYIVEVDAVEKALQDPSILRHADPGIMRQAGWVREDEYNTLLKLVSDIAKDTLNV